MINKQYSALNFGAIKYIHESKRPLKAVENFMDKALMDSPEKKTELDSIENSGIDVYVHTKPEGVNSKVWFSFSKDGDKLKTHVDTFTYNCMFYPNQKVQFAEKLIGSLLTAGTSIKNALPPIPEPTIPELPSPLPEVEQKQEVKLPIKDKPVIISREVKKSKHNKEPIVIVKRRKQPSTPLPADIMKEEKELPKLEDSIKDERCNITKTPEQVSPKVKRRRRQVRITKIPIKNCSAIFREKKAEQLAEQEEASEKPDYKGIPSAQDVDLSPEKVAQRNRLIEQYRPYAISLAQYHSTLLPDNISLDEIIAAAEDGLFNAANKFDPAKGFAFKSFAAPRINGSIKDMLREKDFVSRSTRSRYKDIEKYINNIQNEQKRTPDLDEIAAALGLHPEMVENARIDVESKKLLSLNEPINSDSEDLFIDSIRAKEQDNPLKKLEDKSTKNVLEQTISKLSDKQRAAIEMYYTEGKTLKEIGEELDLTESRACQLLSAAKSLLAKRIKRDDVLD